MIGTLFFRITEVQTFKVVNCCGGRKVRVHWLNDLGGADSFNFFSKRIIRQEVKGVVGERPLTWRLEEENYDNVTHHDPEASGMMRIDVNSNEVYEVESVELSTEVSTWLEELTSSVECFIELDDYDCFLPIVVRDIKEVFDDEDELVKKSLEFEMSNGNIKHRR